VPALKCLIGQNFGRLTVIRREGSDSYGSATWFCQCECGSACVVRGSSLIQGFTNSCGCLHKESAGKNLETHRKTKTRLHTVWKSMKTRCYNPHSNSYKHYGERGITICDEWRNDFQAFYDWSMANGYDENAPRGQCTIDRIDNDKGYSSDNCRWADQKTQQNNKSNNRQKRKEVK
jgi:hypothetical protein